MNKHNNDRSRDKIDSILYRARKNEVDKILGETFKRRRVKIGQAGQEKCTFCI